nr:hypothetical protein HK105_000233 [Polyrhizophydium stewartii]
MAWHDAHARAFHVDGVPVRAVYSRTEDTEEADWYCTGIYAVINAITPIKGVRVVCDRITRHSLGFAFVEFPSLEGANFLLGRIYNQTKPQPLAIDGRPVSVAYAHVSSFVPVYSETPWVSTTFLDESGKVIRVTYWDERAFAIQYPPVVAPEPRPRSETGETKTEQQQQHSKTEPVSAIVRPPQAMASLDSEIESFYLEAEGGGASEAAATDAAASAGACWVRYLSAGIAGAHSGVQTLRSHPSSRRSRRRLDWPATARSRSSCRSGRASKRSSRTSSLTTVVWRWICPRKRSLR